MTHKNKYMNLKTEVHVKVSGTTGMYTHIIGVQI